MRFTVMIQCDGAAFEDDPAAELARLLGVVAERSVMSPAGRLLDANGNQCGTWAFEAEDGDR